MDSAIIGSAKKHGGSVEAVPVAPEVPTVELISCTIDDEDPSIESVKSAQAKIQQDIKRGTGFISVRDNRAQ